MAANVYYAGTASKTFAPIRKLLSLRLLTCRQHEAYIIFLKKTILAMLTVRLQLIRA